MGSTTLDGSFRAHHGEILHRAPGGRRAPRAWLHAQAKTQAGLAVFNAFTGLTALGALFPGILLAG